MSGNFVKVIGSTFLLRIKFRSFPFCNNVIVSFLVTAFFVSSCRFLRKDYLRNIWAYISSKFGYKGCEGVLIFHWKDSIESLFNEIVELGIIGENEFEYDYVMYNYYKFKKDDVNEKKYAERLIKRDVDRRLIL